MIFQLLTSPDKANFKLALEIMSGMNDDELFQCFNDLINDAREEISWDKTYHAGPLSFPMIHVIKNDDCVGISLQFTLFIVIHISEGSITFSNYHQSKGSKTFNKNNYKAILPCFQGISDYFRNFIKSMK